MRTWEPFRLMPLPVDDWQWSHIKACQVCLQAHHWSAVALHEATHLAVAHGLGLEVEFCSIDDSQTVALTELEAGLYGHMIPAGTPIPALVTRLAEDSLERQPKRTIVAMVAPSCTLTGSDQIDAYAALEAQMGVRMAKAMGLDPVDAILDWAKEEVTRHEADILRYAARLAQEGRITL